LIAGLSVVVVIVLLVASSVLRAFSKGVGAFLPNCTAPTQPAQFPATSQKRRNLVVAPGS
jgi:hypothetical protein